MTETGLGQRRGETLEDIFVGDGEMARMMRAHDWAATPLGPPQTWPNGLKLALRILLTSRFEMWLGWGPDIAFFYNDAYRPTLGAKHPRALGMPAKALWSEIWDDVGGRMLGVYQTGQSTWDKQMLLLINRRGFTEETYHTFSYSPLLADDGTVGGLFCAVSEETERVISERRLGTLRALASDLAAASERGAVLAAVERRLGDNARDLPFTLTYLFDDDGSARLVATTGGVDGNAATAVPLPALAEGDGAVWPSARMLAGETLVSVDVAGLAGLPTGDWETPPLTAIAVPLAAAGRERPAGMLIAGVNPHRPSDPDFAGFLQLLAGQIAASLTNTEAYEAERALALALTNERDRLRGLFQQAPGFMCVLRGPDLVFELINASYQQLVGHRPHLIGLPVREALPEIEGQGFFELLDGVMATGKPFVGHNLPVMLQRQPEAPLEKRFLNLVYQPIFEADGRLSGIFAEGSDVTEQMQAEEALRRLNETLEARVNARTLELGDALDRLRQESQERETIQEALRQSQKMEAVGQLTGGIAHDFNNLLTGVLGALELLQKRAAQGRLSEVDRYAAAAESAAKRAAALTHRLLAFSRRQPLDPRPVDANRLVGSMEELISRTIGQDVDLEVVRAAGLWTTLCDPHQLENAILNLAINGRDAMPHGGKLTIETCNAHLDNAYAARERSVKPGQYVCICVTDTGVGMTADIIAKAFEPFFTTKPIGQGTGLGLSMIYGFAQQSNGYAKIYSEPGDGTTVKIYLPRHHGPADPRDEPVAYGQARPEPTSDKVVLVVEDEPSVRNLVVEVLQERGFKTIEAHDGQAGLAILEGDVKIDMLVTDVGLPGLNGRQLADAARARRPDLPILFMTGYAENAAIAGGFLEPGMEMITKPFAVDAFTARVADILRDAE